MSKYIVDTDDFEPMFKVDSIGVFGVGKSVTDNTEEHSWSRIKSIEDFEELNSDYINEHYGSLQDDAYQRGLEEGKKAFDLLDAERDSEYQRGLDDAWEAARKLFSSMADSDIEKAFPTEWNNGGFNALMNLQPQKVIEKLKAYEEKQKADDKIKVGDEVAFRHDDGRPDTVVVVTYIGQDGFIDGMDGRGTQYAHKNPTKWTKTGRHFDIDKILEEMRT